MKKKAISDDKEAQLRYKENSMKLEKAVIISGIATGSVVLSGVLLESYLRIPVTNVATHIPVAIASGIIGATIGKYLKN